MKKIIVVLLLSLTTLSTLACKKDSATQTTATSSPNAGDRSHAPAHAVPGSHEDWCGEHQVPESMCTRCNPKLSAAFRATGDWCEEHGLPESQCKLCNPNLTIERPPQKRVD
jgi:hypothetical protein